MTVEIKFPCKFSWNNDYNDPESAAYQALYNDILNWLNEIFGPILEKYGLHLDLEIDLRYVCFQSIGDINRCRPPPGLRHRRSGAGPEVDVKVNLSGKMDADGDMQEVGENIADECGDAAVDGVKKEFFTVN